MPRTMRVEKLEDLKWWCKHQSLPVVLKADGTWGGNGVRIALTSSQVEQCFSELIRRPRPTEVIKRLLLDKDRFWLPSWLNHSTLPAQVIGQSYVRGRAANCAALCWEGRVLALIGVEVVSTQGAEQGRPASVVRVVDNVEMSLAAQRLAKCLGMSGFFGLDFMIEDSTEAAYLIEMNPRCTKPSRLGLGAGKDMVTALCVEISGKPRRATSLAATNSTIGYFPEAWNCKSEFLETSFADIPMGEIDLIRKLLQPSSERTVLGRAIDYVRQLGLERALWRSKVVGERALPAKRSKVA